MSRTYRSWPARIFLVSLLGCGVAALVGITCGTGVWGAPTVNEQAEMKRAIIGYELAKASQRPAGMVGKTLAKADKAALQARFLRRLERYATGPALAEGDTWDYAAALREDEWDTRELVGVDGKIVYWRHARRLIGSEAHVKAGVAKRYQVVAWDSQASRAVPKRDWVTGVIVNDYTLRQVGGVWKVADSTWWRFYDPATGQLGTGPEASHAVQWPYAAPHGDQESVPTLECQTPAAARLPT